MVSSIKSSIANSEEDEVSFEQSDDTFSNLDTTSTNGSNVAENQIGSIPSSGYIHPTADAVQEIQPSAVIRGADAGGKESENRLPPEKASFNRNYPKQMKDSKKKEPPKQMKDSKEKASFNRQTSKQLKDSKEKPSFNITSPKQLKDSNEMVSFNIDSSKQLKDSNEKASFTVDSPKQLKDSKSKEAWSDKLPSFLSHTTEISSPKDEQQEKDLKFEELTSKETDANIEHAKPPPLAGANVMNVILVAAECAPWSKTGIYS